MSDEWSSDNPAHAPVPASQLPARRGAGNTGLVIGVILGAFLLVFLAAGAVVGVAMYRSKRMMEKEMMLREMERAEMVARKLEAEAELAQAAAEQERADAISAEISDFDGSEPKSADSGETSN
ncbi:MAG: hypothetical protein AAF483_28080 [Planctomycetota bacterium]